MADPKHLAESCSIIQVLCMNNTHNSSITANQQHYCSTAVLIFRFEYRQANPCLCG